jgi:predicted TIM-barrel enzyme
VIKRLLSGIVGLLAIVYLVFLFLPWVKKNDEGFSSEPAGVDIVPGFLSLTTGVGLVLWELLGVAGVRRTTRSDSLVSFFLAAATAALGVVSVIHTKWGSPYPFDVELAYGAYAALALAMMLLAGAIVHLVLHIIETRGL